MSVQARSRADDEAILSILKRADTVAFSEMSREMGKGETYARNVARRVLAADLAESGEPAANVMRGYRWA